MKKSLLLIGSVCVLVQGCSVGMAARTGGVKVEETTQCQSRECFITQDTVEILQTSQRDDGGISETYRFQIKRGSAGRAAMHGLLDVATLGIWEVAGTPIEASKKKKYIVITANYDKDGRLISKSLGNPVSGDEIDNVAEASLPEGSTPVTANGEVVGHMTPDGQLIPIVKDSEVKAES
ncbi:hypothetical protein [Hyphococcus sp. DH-69]|uniref:hypothetical protein n=1 Tax=Hyphococcus formosus TaxID=3143534 RepID=UPI00398AE140